MDAIEKSPTLGRYYEILRGGTDDYADGRDLLPLLTHDFVFEGPIAGRVTGGERFSRGVRGFIDTVRTVSILQTVIGLDGAAVLYDAEMPNGSVRFSEFFEFEGDRIRELRIQYNAQEYIASGGR